MTTEGDARLSDLVRVYDDALDAQNLADLHGQGAVGDALETGSLVTEDLCNPVPLRELVLAGLTELCRK